VIPVYAFYIILCHAMMPMLFHFSDEKAESIGHFIPDASRRRVFVAFFRAV